MTHRTKKASYIRNDRVHFDPNVALSLPTLFDATTRHTNSARTHATTTSIPFEATLVHNITKSSSLRVIRSERTAASLKNNSAKKKKIDFINSISDPTRIDDSRSRNVFEDVDDDDYSNDSILVIDNFKVTLPVEAASNKKKHNKERTKCKRKRTNFTTRSSTGRVHRSRRIITSCCNDVVNAKKRKKHHPTEVPPTHPTEIPPTHHPTESPQTDTCNDVETSHSEADNRNNDNNNNDDDDDSIDVIRNMHISLSTKTNSANRGTTEGSELAPASNKTKKSHEKKQQSYSVDSDDSICIVDPLGIPDSNNSEMFRHLRQHCPIYNYIDPYPQYLYTDKVPLELYRAILNKIKQLRRCSQKTVRKTSSLSSSPLKTTTTTTTNSTKKVALENTNKEMKLFSKFNRNQLYCSKCYCYVCDVPASQCTFHWDTIHCHATSSGEIGVQIWTPLRTQCRRNMNRPCRRKNTT